MPMRAATTHACWSACAANNPMRPRCPLWSDAYLTQLIKKEQYDLDPQEVRRYFAYDNVRDGILQLTRDLMGVEIRPWQTAVWDPSVEAYEMLDGGEVIGRFYFDTHPRPGKFNHAAVFGIRSGVAGGSIPMAALVTSFPAGDHRTGLMEHRDVEVFLHEYGHLIHAMMSGRQALRAVGHGRPGAGLHRGAVEDAGKLRLGLRHAGAVRGRRARAQAIPRELVERMNRARYFGEALRDRRQLSLANASLSYYLGPPEADLTAQFMRAYDNYALQPYPAGVHPQNAFPHLASAVGVLLQVHVVADPRAGHVRAFRERRRAQPGGGARLSRQGAGRRRFDARRAAGGGFPGPAVFAGGVSRAVGPGR